MRVGYETTGFDVDDTGAARAIRTVRALLASDPRVDLVDLRQPPRGAGGPIRRGLARELLWFPWRLPAAARRAGVELLHCPGPLGPPRAIGLPVVVTINDVMALEHPEWFTRSNVLHARLLLRRIVRQAAAVIVPSSHARERAIGAFELDPAGVHVVPYGVDGRFSPGPVDTDALRGMGVIGPYVLTVGKLQPRKNLATAIGAFERLVAGGGTTSLVVAGARGWRDDALLARLAASPARGRVIVAGRVSDEQLVALYRGAACLLFPSRYEGFGFPPLEAMACGTPVVSSNATSLTELVGDAGVLVDPGDAVAMSAALRRVLEDEALAAELRRRGLRRAGSFSWRACLERTLGVYRAARVAKGPRVRC